MPGKDSGDQGVKFEPLIIYIIGLAALVVASWKPKEPVPLPAVQEAIIYPTDTAVPTPANLKELMVMNGVSVNVVDETGKPFEPFSEVELRVSNSPQADNGQDGQLLIQRCDSNQVIRVWAPGHEVTTAHCDQASNSYKVTLYPLKAYDNPYYAWTAADPACNTCHGNQLGQNFQTGASFDEMNEWLRSGHAKVFDGGYFQSMYMGTSLSGKMSSTVNPVIIGNEWVPVPPDQGANYHGPGFMLDFPQQGGNCAFCHVPTAVQASEEEVHLGAYFPRPAGVVGEGVTCDVCHKVFAVTLDDRRLPFTNRPGVLSYQFMRPQDGIFMMGPFINSPTMQNGATANHRLSCTPLLSQSEFCAPCHFGKFGDMVIYNSYGEWRQSPYAANVQDPGYRTCQDCHMSHMDSRDTRTVWAQRAACSAQNLLYQTFDHSMMDVGRVGLPQDGQEIPRMVQNAAEIAVDFAYQLTGLNTLDVTVQVTNTQAGHKFPTDSPLRHLILLVRAEDRVQTPLMQSGGERIPGWAGPGPVTPTDSSAELKKIGVEDYSGLPGKAFANLLVEEETNLSPAIAYWNETKYAFQNPANGMTSDTRLRPRDPDTSIYSFAAPDTGEVTVTVTLIYRYAFYDLLVWKEWFDRPDIIVATVQCQGPASRPDLLRQSCEKIGP